MPPSAEDIREYFGMDPDDSTDPPDDRALHALAPAAVGLQCSHYRHTCGGE